MIIRILITILKRNKVNEFILMKRKKILVAPINAPDKRSVSFTFLRNNNFTVINKRKSKPKFNKKIKSR